MTIGTIESHRRAIDRGFDCSTIGLVAHFSTQSVALLAFLGWPVESCRTIRWRDGTTKSHRLLMILIPHSRKLPLTMPRDSHETKTKSKNKSKQTASFVDTNNFSTLSHASSSSAVAYASSMGHHQIGYNEYLGVYTEEPSESSAPAPPASDCPWNSYDNVPPTPAPAFPDDPPDYDVQPPDIFYDRQETAPGASQRTDFVGSEVSPRPSTPMVALATPPGGYEWYISSAYQAYLVPLAGTNSTSAHINSISTGTISMALAPYGLPTPPPEADTGHCHSPISISRRGLPEWIAANPGRELVDVLDERDYV
jgi:hypothetical protein